MRTRTQRLRTSGANALSAARVLACAEELLQKHDRAVPCTRLQLSVGSFVSLTSCCTPSSWRSNCTRYLQFERIATKVETAGQQELGFRTRGKPLGAWEKLGYPVNRIKALSKPEHIYEDEVLGTCYCIDEFFSTDIHGKTDQHENKLSSGGGSGGHLKGAGRQAVTKDPAEEVSPHRTVQHTTAQVQHPGGRGPATESDSTLALNCLDIFLKRSRKL